MKRQTITTDWGALLDDLAEAGVTFPQLRSAVGIDISDRMASYYRAGRQPRHWVGELMISVWCKATGNSREKVPKCELVRGRVVKVEGPRVQDVAKLTDWLKPTQKERGKPGRKAKVKAEVA